MNIFHCWQYFLFILWQFLSFIMWSSNIVNVDTHFYLNWYISLRMISEIQLKRPADNDVFVFPLSWKYMRMSEEICLVIVIYFCIIQYYCIYFTWNVKISVDRASDRWLSAVGGLGAQHGDMWYHQRDRRGVGMMSFVPLSDSWSLALRDRDCPVLLILFPDFSTQVRIMIIGKKEENVLIMVTWFH